LLSRSYVSRPYKRLVLMLVTCPATIFVVANWWVIGCLVIGAIVAAEESHFGSLALLIPLQFSMVLLHRLNEWIAAVDTITDSDRARDALLRY
jgi:hypothetical protein